jgi:hypothetical protein
MKYCSLESLNLFLLKKYERWIEQNFVASSAHSKSLPQNDTIYFIARKTFNKKLARWDFYFRIIEKQERICRGFFFI